MKLAVNLLEPGLIDVGVNLRGREARVAEHLLDRAQIGSVAEQMRGKRVAQEMRPNLLGQAREFGHLPHDLPDPRRGQPPAMFPEKDFAAGLRLDQERPAPGQPAVERRHGFFSDRDHPLAVPLPDDAQKLLLAQIILQAQPDDFPARRPLA